MRYCSSFTNIGVGIAFMTWPKNAAAAERYAAAAPASAEAPRTISSPSKAAGIGRSEWGKRSTGDGSDVLGHRRQPIGHGLIICEAGLDRFAGVPDKALILQYRVKVYSYVARSMAACGDRPRRSFFRCAAACDIGRPNEHAASHACNHGA